jgi:hypothetical protein
MDASNVIRNFNYIETPFNLDSQTFMELIKWDNHKPHECWINSITFLDGDTIMDTNQKIKASTCGKLTSILDETEDAVKLGVYVHGVYPFVQHHKLALRVFYVFEAMICRRSHVLRDPRQSRSYINK